MAKPFHCAVPADRPGAASSEATRPAIVADVRAPLVSHAVRMLVRHRFVGGDTPVNGRCEIARRAAARRACDGINRLNP